MASMFREPLCDIHLRELSKQMKLNMNEMEWNTANEANRCENTSFSVKRLLFIKLVCIGHMVTVLNVSAPRPLKSCSHLAGTIRTMSSIRIPNWPFS